MFMSYRTAADLTQHIEDPHKTAILAKEERLFKYWYRCGALRMVNNGPELSRTLDNGPEWSPGALGRVSGGPERRSLEVFRECMGSPGTVLKALVTGMCARRGFKGSPKHEILSFLQPLWCDLHVFQGPTWDRLRV